jgi:hypothetical protein
MGATAEMDRAMAEAAGMDVATAKARLGAAAVALEEAKAETLSRFNAITAAYHEGGASAARLAMEAHDTAAAAERAAEDALRYAEMLLYFVDPASH